MRLARLGDERSSKPRASSATTPCVGGGISTTSVPRYELRSGSTHAARSPPGRPRRASWPSDRRADGAAVEAVGAFRGDAAQGRTELGEPDDVADARRRAEFGRTAHALPDRGRARRDREALLGGVDRGREVRVEPEPAVSLGERRPAGDRAGDGDRARAARRHRRRAARPCGAPGPRSRGRRASRRARRARSSRRRSPSTSARSRRGRRPRRAPRRPRCRPARARGCRHGWRAAGSSPPCRVPPPPAVARRRSGSSCRRDLRGRSEHAREPWHDREHALARAVGDVRVEPARVQVARTLRRGQPFLGGREAAGQSVAAAAESAGSPPSSSAIRPAQYASSIASSPRTPAQRTATSSAPWSRAARATASRLSREPTRTRLHRSAAASSSRVPFVVVRTSVSAAGSTNSRGELPKSKPSIRTVFRSPPRTAPPSAAATARASSTSAQQRTRR